MPSTGNFGGQKVAESSLLAKSFTSCLNRQISSLGWWIPSEKAPDEADMCVLLFAELWSNLIINQHFSLLSRIGLLIFYN